MSKPRARINTIRKRLANYFNIEAEAIHAHAPKTDPVRKALLVGVYLAYLADYKFEKIAEFFGYTDLRHLSKKIYKTAEAMEPNNKYEIEGGTFETVSMAGHEIGYGHLLSER